MYMLLMTKSIGEIMTEKLETLSSSATAQEAAKKMRDKNVSSLVVIDSNQKAMGIVTERSLVRKICINDSRSSSILIQDIMSSPLITIDSNSPVEAAADVMMQNKVRHLLVVENNDIGRPVGIITPTDFNGYLKENLNIIDSVNAKIIESLKEEE